MLEPKHKHAFALLLRRANTRNVSQHTLYGVQHLGNTVTIYGKLTAKIQCEKAYKIISWRNSLNLVCTCDWFKVSMWLMFLFFFKGNSQEDFFQRATLQSSTMGKDTFPVGVTSLAKLCSLTVHRGEVMHKSILAVTTPLFFFLSLSQAICLFFFGTATNFQPQATRSWQIISRLYLLGCSSLILPSVLH